MTIEKTYPILFFLVILAGCASPTPPPTSQTGVHLQGIFEVPELIAPDQSEMGYLLYLPDGYWDDPDRLWPLIVSLHGSGDADNDSGFVMSSGLPEALYAGEAPVPFPFIALAPQAFPGATWWDEGIPETLTALLDEIAAVYQVDPARIYLTGVSMGGYGTWRLAAEYPDRFAAVVSVSGSGFRTPTIPGDDVMCRLEDVPVWGIHGALDMISDPRVSLLFISALEECGGEVKWTLYPDTGHLSTMSQAYRDPTLYEWLLEH
jgi:predicted peptidase